MTKRFVTIFISLVTTISLVFVATPSFADDSDGSWGVYLPGKWLLADWGTEDCNDPEVKGFAGFVGLAPYNKPDVTVYWKGKVPEATESFFKRVRRSVRLHVVSAKYSACDAYEVYSAIEKRFNKGERKSWWFVNFNPPDTKGRFVPVYLAPRAFNSKIRRKEIRDFVASRFGESMNIRYRLGHFWD